MAWDDRGATFATFEQQGKIVEQQTCLNFLGVPAMAFKTAIDEQWADAFFEEGKLFGGGLSGRLCGKGSHDV